jgi:hypothetical protein
LVICLASDIAVVNSKYHSPTTRVSLQVKESLCYVSADFMGELQAARLAGKVTRAPAAQPVGGNSDASSGANTLGRTAPALDPLGGALKKQFVLPDFHTVLKGYVKPDDEPNDPKEQVCYYVLYCVVKSVNHLLQRATGTLYNALGGLRIYTFCLALLIPHSGVGYGDRALLRTGTAL